MKRKFRAAAVIGSLVASVPVSMALGMPASAQGASAGLRGAQAGPPAALAQALDHERRAEDRARDRYRNPAETLATFQVEPGMTVVDYLPGAGWYTRVLVPYLGSEGHYVAMGPNVGSLDERMRGFLGGLAERFPEQAAGWGLGENGARISAFNAEAYPESLDGAVDRVLIFRGMHNLFRNGWLHGDMQLIRQMLKPDGMVGIVAHRAAPDAPFAMTDGNQGYMRQSDVIGLLDAYGFDLVAESEVNANPRDTGDHERGVWALPPGLAGATDATREQMLAIGESDRMTLLFRKRD